MFTLYLSNPGDTDDDLFDVWKVLIRDWTPTYRQEFVVEGYVLLVVRVAFGYLICQCQVLASVRRTPVRTLLRHILPRASIMPLLCR